MEQLKSFILKKTNLPEHEWEKTKGCLTKKFYSKGQELHFCKKETNKIFFINNGLVRSYFNDTEGKDFTWSLHFNNHGAHIENLFITDFASLIRKRTNQLRFETLEDTSVIEIKNDDLQSWYRESHDWMNTGRMIAEEAYCFTRDRALSLLTQTATQRYIELKEQHPNFVEQTSQFHIASYLGITPQSLSRIKKNAL